jgi:hypothetical protein
MLDLVAARILPAGEPGGSQKSVVSREVEGKISRMQVVELSPDAVGLKNSRAAIIMHAIRA